MFYHQFCDLFFNKCFHNFTAKYGFIRTCECPKQDTYHVSVLSNAVQLTFWRVAVDQACGHYDETRNTQQGPTGCVPAYWRIPWAERLCWSGVSPEEHLRSSEFTFQTRKHGSPWRNYTRDFNVRKLKHWVHFYHLIWKMSTPSYIPNI